MFWDWFRLTARLLSLPGCGWLADHRKCILQFTLRGNFRSKNTVDNNDTHFALRVSNFDDTLRLLKEKGFLEDFAEGDPKCLLVKRTGPAGFPQIYLFDPDGHVLEINAAG